MTKQWLTEHEITQIHHDYHNGILRDDVHYFDYDAYEAARDEEGCESLDPQYIHDMETLRPLTQLERE